jgi:hypothetical protein
MEQVTVRGRPAFATLPPDGPPSGEAPAGESYTVEARVLRFEGERYFWADGEVDVVQDSLHMTSDSLAYDRELGTLVFTGDARMTNETGDFRGRRIALTLSEGEVTSVLVQGSARLTTEDMDLVAAEIRLELLDGLLQRLVAVSVDGSGVGAPETPHLVTEDFLLTGDSLEVSSPSEVLESVLAIGNAWGQAHVRGDSVPLLALRPSERLQGAPVTSRSLETDWIEGDQIEVSFSRASRPAVTPGAPVDSVSTGGAPMPEVEGETYVSRLLAVGDAKTLYRRPPESDGVDGTVSGAPTPAQGDDAPSREGWPISYILASEIAVFFQEGGEVQRIEADTDVRGLQLDPLTPASAARGTGVPSTAAPADASP